MVEENQVKSKPKIMCPLCDYDGDMAQIAKHLELSSTTRELAWLIVKMLIKDEL